MKNDRVFILNSFAKNLKVKRENFGVSQAKLAEICELDRTYISMLETGKRNPSLINLVKLSNALKITTSCLLEGVEG
ncbi:MAG: helix-turn-helix transcriptional regulator [Methylococcales bacterium]|nr:helix-turn-helix transcriptional regulator [Methylococcales bacterium]